MPLEAADIDAHPTIKAMQASLGDVGKLLKGVVTIQQQQSAVLNDIRTKVASAPAAHNEPDDDSDDEPVDVNSLDNSAFQKLLMKEIGGIIDEKLGAFGQKVDGVANTFHTDRLRKEYGELKKDHPDFDDWQEEMQALAKENPGLGLKRLYTLARSENDVKAKELDAKYAKAKGDGKEKDDHTLTLFGGFRPTIGKTDGDQPGKKGEKLTADQAGAKAWEETVAKFPGLASLETNPLD